MRAENARAFRNFFKTHNNKIIYIFQTRKKLSRLNLSTLINYSISYKNEAHFNFLIKSFF